MTRGGHIFYVEMDGDATHNPEVIMQVVDMMDRYNIGYGSVNHNRNRCLDCGYENAETHLEKCPKCGSDVVKGKFGAYCKQKCGMNVGRAMGATFSDTQMKSLLEGKKTLVRGLKGKKGSYDAYLIPEGIEDYSYIKDGKEIKGSQYKFKMEFPPRKSK